jgi:tetratricopeptide (TPR) repeat protein
MKGCWFGGMAALVFVFLPLAPSSTAAPTRQTPPRADAASQLIAQAEAARLAGRAEEAIALYRRVTSSRPRWAEGWWYLGTLLYERDAYADAAAAFQRATALNPDVGTAWVMLGLCEFRLGQHDAALTHIQKGQRLGISADPQFKQVMRYHEGLLLLGTREFERAQEVFRGLSAEGVDSDELIIALGRSVLRLPPNLPGEEPAAIELVRRAGRAEHLAAQHKFTEALRAYEQLTIDFPKTRHVQYALGRHFVARREPDKAVEAYEREIANSPDHVPARLGIAAIKAGSDPADALRYAEDAVRLNPRIPLGHYVLGMLLLEHTPDTSRAIAELEMAERSVRDDPGIYYALRRAYLRAGRTKDAERAQTIFKRLTEERDEAARRSTGGTSRSPSGPPPP